MQIRIKNRYLKDSIDFLYNMVLKGKQSRHRTRFVNLLNEKFKQVGEEEIELLKEYAETDGDGNLKNNGNGGFDIKDIKGFTVQQKELFDEDFVIEGGNHHGMLKTVKEILFDYDEEVSGKAAEAFDHLCEAFENTEKGAE